MSALRHVLGALLPVAIDPHLSEGLHVDELRVSLPVDMRVSRAGVRALAVRRRPTGFDTPLVQVTLTVQRVGP